MYSSVQGVDLRLLRIFATIAQCQGFSAAQAQLNMNQSAISTSMANLEARLGYRLCDRGKRGFHLTEEGKKILRATQELFESMEGFVSRVRSLSGRLFGEISIGLLDSTLTLGDSHMAQSLARFYQRDQDVRVHLSIKSPTELEQDVLDGTLDAAITYIGHRLSVLEYIDLFDEEMSAYCGVNHPLYRQGVSDTQQLLNFQWVRRGYMVPNYLAPIDPPMLTAVAHQMEGVALLVLAGTHIGYLPRHYAQQWEDKGQMRVLSPEDLSYKATHSLIINRTRVHDEALEAFIDDVLAEHHIERKRISKRLSH